MADENGWTAATADAATWAADAAQATTWGTASAATLASWSVPVTQSVTWGAASDTTAPNWSDRTATPGDNGMFHPVHESVVTDIFVEFTYHVADSREWRVSKDRPIALLTVIEEP